MNDYDADIARFRRAGELLAWENFAPRQQDPAVLEHHKMSVRGVVYAGTVAAAARATYLRAGEGYSFADSMIEVLTVDRLGNQAGNELGVVNCLRNEVWIQSVQADLEARAAEIAPPTLTATERFHRRAAVEYILEHAQPDPVISTAAFAAYVEVMAAARTRWNLGEFAFVEGTDPLDLVRDVVAAEPIAAAADMELDQGRKNYAASVMAEHWDEIREKAADLETTAAIAEAVVGPEQRVESARRGARLWMQAHNITDPDILAYGGALAAGRARWLQAGADPEQLDLFEVRTAELDTAGVADRLSEQTRDLARQVVTGAWSEIAGDPTA